jgi:hypothetical protein
LLAGGWSAADSEADGRARLDMAMRRDLPYFTTLAALLRLAERLAAEGVALCPQSLAALEAFRGEQRRATQAAARALGGGFPRLPGGARLARRSPLSSHEFQARRALARCSTASGVSMPARPAGFPKRCAAWRSFAGSACSSRKRAAGRRSRCSACSKAPACPSMRCG